MHKHGGNIYEASKIHGVEIEDILDYSANINPLGLPEGLRDLLISGFDKLVNYPDPEYTELRMNISKYLNVDVDRIIPGNGASEVIYLMFESLDLKRIMIPAPSFSEYTQAAHAAGVQTDFFELREENGFRLQVEDLLDKIDNGYDALFLCNPNNPTSTLLSIDELNKILRFTASRKMYLIIDEAFIELTEGGNENSMVTLLSSFDNLFIIRAFTKLFAIPGLRLGYGLGNREVISEMWRKKQPWSINALACEASRLLDNCSDYLRETAHWLAEEKDRFYKELSNIKGLKVFEPQTNFILIKLVTASLNASQLKSRLTQKGVLIRDASNFTFLSDKFFRIAIKGKESNNKFLTLLNEIMNLN